MRLRNGTARLWLLTLLLVAMPGAAVAQVSVYAEGAYTATDLAVYLYADIAEANPLCSYGVSLNFNPAKITAVTATKNEDAWYFGTTGSKQPYMNPEMAAGKIIFIGGKLDTSNPPTSATAGVKGTRVLLGKATFNRVSGQDTAFGITIDLGKTHPPFDNFVTSDTADVLDGPGLFTSVTIRQRGDANGDGSITGADNSSIKFYLVNGGVAHPWMDCNGDGAITGADNSCVKYLLTH